MKTDKYVLSYIYMICKFKSSEMSVNIIYYGSVSCFRYRGTLFTCVENIFYLLLESLLLTGSTPSGTHIVVDKKTSISTLRNVDIVMDAMLAKHTEGP